MKPTYATPGIVKGGFGMRGVLRTNSSSLTLILSQKERGASPFPLRGEGPGMSDSGILAPPRKKNPAYAGFFLH
jgi:hypothetical protein